MNKLNIKEFLKGWTLIYLGNNRYMAMARKNNLAKVRIAWYKKVGKDLIKEVAEDE